MERVSCLFFVIAHRLITVSVIAFVVLFGCGRDKSGVSGPTPTGDVIVWNGIAITGERSQEAVPLVQEGVTSAARKLGDNETSFGGWTVVMYLGRIPCNNLCCGIIAPDGCRGVTEMNKRRVSVSWINGPRDVVAIVEWEFCNIIHVRREGQISDRGCAA